MNGIRSTTRRLGAALLLLAAACSGDSTGGGGTPAAIQVLSGTAQSGNLSQTLPNPVVVRVSDAAGEPVRGATIRWEITGGGEVSGAARTDGAGLAQGTWKLGPAIGQQTAVAYVDGVGEPAIFTAQAELGQGQELTLVKVSGDGQTGPAANPLAQPLVVEARLNGTPVQGVNVHFQVYGNAAVDPVEVLTDAQGRATARHTLGTRAGPQQVDAYIPGMNAAAVMFATTVLPGPAIRLEGTIIDGRVAPLGGVDTAYVAVLDAYDNRIPGVTVSWTVLAGGGTVTASSVSRADGLAPAVWTFGRTERSQIVRADAPGIAPGAVTLLAPVTLPQSGPPARLEKVSGDNQTTTLAMSVRAPLVVRVLDAQGRGVPGAEVRWDGFAYTADSLGYSRVRLHGHPSEPQPVTHTASLAGLGESATFTVNTTLGPPGKLVAYSDTLFFDAIRLRYSRPGFVVYNAQGRVGFIGGSSRLDAQWYFLDNTGAAGLGISGNLGFWVESYQDGEDRMAVQRDGVADTVLVIVRQKPVWIDTPGSLSLSVGQSTIATLMDGNNRPVAGAQWTSSDPSVVTVVDGRYTAVSRGVAVIRGEKNGVRFSLGISVF